jgi:hypothetical protein
VHVAGLSADEGFVRFNLPGQLVARSHAQREPDAVVHEPRSLLGDVQRPRTSQLLTPFLQLETSHIATSHLSRPSGESSIDGPGLQGELLFGMLVPALPAVLVRQEDYVLHPQVGHSTPLGQRRATT